jgi:HKD family nuclease
MHFLPFVAVPGNPKMPDVTLISSPGSSYVEQLVAVLDRSTSFWLITAFASPAGFQLLLPALDRLFAKPEGQGQIVVAVDRQGFNAAPIFHALLELKRRVGPRLDLGIVPQNCGLLHAKALLAEGATGTELIIGSANLTQSAFRANHELGVHVLGVPAQVKNGFYQFFTSLHPYSLNEANAEGFLREVGMVRPTPPPVTAVRPIAGSWQKLVDAIKALEILQPLPADPDDHVVGWIEKGYLVGRGRPATDALVVRLPLDALEQRGLVDPIQIRSLGAAAIERRALGYAIRLVPAADAESIRKESRHLSLVRTRLSLNLPCFGLWMPAAYWDDFLNLSSRLLSGDVLSPDRIRALATTQREYLLKEGGLDKSLDQIVMWMQKDKVLRPQSELEIRRFLLDRLQQALQDRTPDVIANAIQFRTARQRWAPFEQTDVPFRQLMVDVIQATFGTTYRTGKWPSQFRSWPAREIAHSIEAKLDRAGYSADGATALQVLELASTWEDPSRDFAGVVDEFRRFVPSELEFVAPKPEELQGDAMADEEESDES